MKGIELWLVPLLNKTPMCNENKIKSICTVNSIFEKIENKKYLGDSLNYNLNVIKSEIIKLLKGSSNLWKREFQICYTNLNFTYVVNDNKLLYMEIFSQSSPENDNSFLVKNSIYPGLFIWGENNSNYINIVKKDTSEILSVLSQFRNDKRINYTYQADTNLIKINMMSEKISFLESVFNNKFNEIYDSKSESQPEIQPESQPEIQI